MKWFKDINSLDELRKAYKKLVVKHHPDNGGSDEAIKSINAEYDIIFKKFKAGYEHSDSYKNTTERQRQTYNTVKDQKLREMVIKLSKYPKLTVEICGVWIWVSGDTKAYKEELKALGLHYARNKKSWYIHFDDFVKYGKKSASMQYIREKYGSVVVHSGNEEESKNKRIKA